MKNLTRIILVLVLVIPRTILLQAQEPVTFFIDTVRAEINEPIEVPVFIEDFEDVSGFQFTLQWDTARLTFDSIADLNIPNLNLSNLSTTQADTGILTVAWFSSGLNNISLPDSTLAFNLYYRPFSSCDSTAQVRFTDSPTDQLVVRIINGTPTEIPSAYIDGAIISTCPILEAAGLANNQADGASGCAPFEVNFVDDSNYESDIVNWQWLSGDGQSNTDTNTVFTYSQAGTYTAMLILTDPFRSDTADFIIDVIAQPDISIEVQQDQCNPQAVIFSATNNGAAAISSWRWDFGDMTGSNLQNPLKLFPNLNTTYDITLEVEDENGCTNTFTTTVFVPDFSPISLSVLLQESPGCGSATGRVALAPSGGTPPYTYGWSHDSELMDSIATNLVAGDYDITLTDAQDCTVEFTYTLEPVDIFPTVNLGADIGLCQGQSAMLNAGSEGTDYAWSLDGTTLPDALGATLEVTDPGTYVAIVTNNSNCSTADTVVVSALATPILALANDTTLCTNEFLTLDAQNPGASFSWALNGNPIADATEATLTTTLAGTYTVEVTNTDNCTAQDTFNLQLDTAPIPDLGMDQTICESTTTSLNANASGTFEWFLNGDLIDGATEADLEVTAAGTYVVQISNTNNCTGTDTLELTVNALPAIDLGDDQTICASDSVTLDAGDNGAVFNWTLDGIILVGETMRLLQANQAGTYGVLVTDANNCVNSDTVSLNVIPLPTVELGADQAICMGESTMLVGTSDGLSFQWLLDGSPLAGATDPILEASEAGSYTLQATSADGCSNTDSLSLTVNPLPVVELGADTSFCGPFELLLNAGNEGATFQWFLDGDLLDDETAAILLADAAGSYQVEVTDTNNCSASDSIMLREEGEIMIALGADTLICAGEFVPLQAGVATDDIQWFLDGTPIPGATAPGLNANQAGTYSVALLRGANCVGADTIVVEVSALPAVELGTDQQFCAGGSLTLNANATADTFSWLLNGEPLADASDATLDTSSPGQYEVVATNLPNCTATDLIVVTEVPNPVVDLGPDTTRCTNTTLVLDAGNAGASFNWIVDGELVDEATMASFSPAMSGEHIVVVTDENNCTSSDTTNVTIFPAPSFALPADTIICLEDSLVLMVTVSDADSFHWSLDGVELIGATSAMLPINEAGTYALEASNSSGCSASSAFTATLGDRPPLDLGMDASFCANTSFLVQTNISDATIEWTLDGAPFSPPSPEAFEATSPGVYVASANAGACTAVDTLVLSALPLPTVELGEDTVLCAGDALLLMAMSDAPQLVWTIDGEVVQEGAANLFQTDQSGTYVVSATNAQGCSFADTLLIAEGILPDPTLGANLGICTNDTLVLNAGPGATFEWFFNEILIDTAQSASLSITTPGDYRVMVTSVDNCMGEGAASVAAFAPPPLNLGVDTSICVGTSLPVVLACTECTAEWQDGSNQLARSLGEADTYSVEITSPQGCTAADTLVLGLLERPVVELGDSLELCPNEQLTIEAGTFASYQWSTGASTSAIDFEAPASTSPQDLILWVEVSNEDDCTDRDSIQLTILPVVSAAIETSTNTACEGDTIQLIASGGTLYEWMVPDSIISESDIADPLGFPTETTTFQVLVSNDCPSNVDSAFVTIKIDPAPAATAGPDTCILLGQDYEFSASGGISYAWEENLDFPLSDLGIANPMASPRVTTTYIVEITGENGCSLIDSVQVLIADNPNNFVETVNIITPNGDGQNDFLEFDGLGKYQENELIVFNRWGNIVYQQKTYENDWEGTNNNGQELPAGVYFYVLRIQPGNAEIKSTLTIVRE
ncbi:MAG: PKD domain-containing protein [Bacteroidota bacterium]